MLDTKGYETRVCILAVAAFVLLITAAGRTSNQTASPQPTTGTVVLLHPVRSPERLGTAWGALCSRGLGHGGAQAITA
ncbi:MAG: hypothetical protein ABSE80_08980 [Halobacteriota archaeon]